MAGFMPVVELPHSELKIRIGLMMMAPHHKTEIKGRGIFQTRKLFLEDRLKGNDPELSWILKDIKSINKCFQKSVTAKI
jgi:hypothetical protein